MKRIDVPIKRCVDELGRIVLPRDMRNYYNIKSGDVLVVVATEEGILLKPSCEKDNTENEA